MILAISAAPEAIPPNPKIAAITAIIKKVNVQRNILLGFIYQTFLQMRAHALAETLYNFGN